MNLLKHFLVNKKTPATGLFLAGQTGFDALPQDIKREMALDYSAELRLNLSTFFPVPFIPVYLKLLFMI